MISESYPTARQTLNEKCSQLIEAKITNWDDFVQVIVYANPIDLLTQERWGRFLDENKASKERTPLRNLQNEMTTAFAFHVSQFEDGAVEKVLKLLENFTPTKTKKPFFKKFGIH